MPERVFRWGLGRVRTGNVEVVYRTLWDLTGPFIFH
jgi:hypothetical protein